MRNQLKQFTLAAACGLLLVGCSQEPESLPTAPAPQAPLDVTAAPVVPEAVAPVAPPPGSGTTPVAIAAPAPLTESDLLGGSGRPLTDEEKMLLNYGIDMFKNDKGYYPKTLAEAVASRHITRLPKLPTDEQLNYDPLTGKVTVEKK
jgi:hypothetical protein